jgi:hypothetical protein
LTGLSLTPNGWSKVAGRPALSRIDRADRAIPRHLPNGAHLTRAADASTDSVVPAPPAGPTRSNWQVTYTGFDAASNVNGPQAEAAFQAAVNIWSQVVFSSVPIKVDADFADLPTDVLGEAGPSAAYSRGGVLYVSALADAIAGTDVSQQFAGAPSEDIDAQFSSDPSADFYYGTDGAPPAGEVDFESVVLHELGHGLGFLGSMEVKKGVGSYTTNYPLSYDDHAYTAASGGVQLVSMPSGTAALAAVLQSGSVYWGGPVAQAADDGARPRLFAPATWEDGSSFSHLDEATYPIGDPNSLMTPAISDQEVIHSPGPIAVGMLADQGWTAVLSNAPAAPTSVVATPADGQATVSWTAPPDSGTPIDQYVVVASDGRSSCSTAGATHCTVTGLTNGSLYTFTVRAATANGTGLPSIASAAVTPFGVPGSPLGVDASRQDGAALVSWEDQDDNGSPILQYTATASPGGHTCTTTNWQCSVTGLTNGVSYSFTVVATNAAGPSLPSVVSPSVTPSGVPGQPSIVGATAGNTTAEVSWQAPDDNGAAITAYTATSTPDGLSCTTTGSTECTIDDLTNGTGYTFTVVATNDAGTGQPSLASTTVTPTGPPATTPAAPAHPTATDTSGLITVRWSAPSFDGGKPIVGYDLEYSSDGTHWTSLSPALHTETSTLWMFSGLAPGAIYTFRVAAINALGTGAYSTPSTGLAELTVPDPPTGITAVAGDGQATVSWVAPAKTGGDPILGYDLEDSTLSGNWVSVSSAFHSSPATTETVPSLVDGVALRFRVAAITADGTSTYSAVAAVTPYGVVSAITVSPSSTITVGHAVTLRAAAEDMTTAQRIGEAEVRLVSRTDRSSPFRAVTTRYTNANGAVSVKLRPTVNTQFEWRMIGDPRHAGATSAVRTVWVAAAVKVALTRAHAGRGQIVDLFGTVTPKAAGQVVYLERKVGSRWELVGRHAVIARQRMPNGKRTLGFVMAVPTTKPGTTTYRVLRKATGGNVAGTSKPMTISIS